MADEKIVIKIDLDASDVENQFKQIEVSAQGTAETVEKSFSTTIGDRIDSIINTVNKLVSVVAIGSIALKAFGLDIVKLFKKIGINIEPVIEAFVKFRNIILAIIKDPSLQNFKKLRNEILGLLSKLGLLNNTTLLFLARLDVLGPTILKIIKSSELLSSVFDKLKFAAGGAFAIIGIGVKNVKEIVRVSGGLANIFLGNIRNLFGLTTALASVSAGLLLFGETVKRSNNEFIRFSGIIATTAGIIIGGFAAALAFAIVKVGQLAQEIGSSLVRTFQSATDKFIKANEGIVLFTKTIENFDRVTRGAVGTTESWAAEVSELGEVFNLSQSSLQKAAAEIVNVGSALHLNERQMKSLLTISAEYAKINGKDVFDTSVKLVGALNGNAQAVTALGIKLNEAATSSFALKRGLASNFQALGDGEKVQVRFNSLVEQYAKVAGLGAATAGTLADQNEKFRNNVEKLNSELGAGAAIIENNNLVAAALNTVLNNVNSTVTKAAGFFGALGARVLQVGGFFLEWSFKIFAVIKAFKVLDLLLSSDLTKTAFGKSIPILGTSITGLIRKLAGAEVQLTSAAGAFQAFKLIVLKEGNKISKLLFGIGINGLTLRSIFTGLFKNLAKGLKIAIPLLSRLTIAAAPFLLKFTLIAGIIKLVVTAFQEAERQTGFFSEAFAILKKAATETASVFEPLKTLFGEFGVIVKTVVDKSIGLMVVSLNGLLRLVGALVEKNPFGAFSKETVDSFKSLNARIDSFNSRLIASGFSFSELGKRALASKDDINTFIREVRPEDLQRLRESLQDIGKSDLTLLKEQLDERLDLLTRSREQELLNEKDFFFLKNQALLDYNTRRQEILNKLFEEQNKEAIAFRKNLEQNVLGGILKVTATSFEALGAALAGAKTNFREFGKVILGIIGDVLITIGTSILATGKAIEALKASLTTFFGGFAIIAGLALITLGGALKALGGGGLGVPTPASGGEAAAAPQTLVPPEIEEQEKQTAVTVNVEGAVLDPVGTGQQIVAILQETFDTNGSQVVTNVG